MTVPVPDSKLAGEARRILAVARRRRQAPRGGGARRPFADRRPAAGDARRGDRRRGESGDRPRPRRLPQMAQRPGAAPRRTRPPARRGTARRQGRARPAGDDRGRQGRVGGARRSAGDDRHLRLRRRPVAPALRPDDPVRAPRPQADRGMAAGRRRRRHFGVQLPGRGVVVERGAGASSAAIRSCGSRRRRRRCRRWRSRRCTAARRPSSAPTRPTTC